MNKMDQYRAVISMRERIRQLKDEFGDESAWDIVEIAVMYNLAQETQKSLNNTNEYVKRSIKNHS